MSLSAAVALPARAVDVNNFTISDYKIEYTLGRDSENRSTLKTTETITAQFPDFDQNRGLERAIPKSYDGHRTDVKIESVVDGQGQPRTFDTRSDDNGNLVVRMADMSRYVHGAQTYRLTYTQRDVTRYFENTQRDEFYWDTNGTGWKVPIERLSVRVMVDEALRSRLSGDSACYIGEAGSTNQCEIKTENGAISAQADGIAPGHNITLALGFAPDTFAQFQHTLLEKILITWGVIQAGLLAVGTALLAWIGTRMYRIVNRSSERQPVVTEYLPPKDHSVTVTATIARGDVRGSVMVAQLLDLAVRHYIKLYELPKKGMFGTAEYEIEILRELGELKAEEQELLRDMFNKLPAPGERLNLKTLRNNMGYAARTQDNDSKLTKLIRETYELRARDETLTKWLRNAAIILAGTGVATLSPVLLVVALIVFGLSWATWRLTDAGLALRRYSDGLKQYIGVAEQERLQMLQSPEGADKVVAEITDTSDTKQLVKLYEKVLPYAVLYGQEKNWTKQLGHYYEQVGAQPDWYSGQAAFNAAAFGAGMSGLSQAASYTSSSSSTSGGSGGGGSSGGGGGGGGGGGV